MLMPLMYQSNSCIKTLTLAKDDVFLFLSDFAFDLVEKEVSVILESGEAHTRLSR